MKVEYCENRKITAEEMLALAKAAGFAAHRNIERNTTAIEGSVFIARARCEKELIGLIRLIGDGAYVLHVADLMVAPAFQKKGVGRQLLNMAIDFARNTGVGTGADMGEFTLFAAPGAEDFYSKAGFLSVPNGMCFADTEQRRKVEQELVRHWGGK